MINDQYYDADKITEEAIEQALGIVFPYKCTKEMRQSILDNQWSSFEEWKQCKEKRCEIIQL